MNKRNITYIAIAIIIIGGLIWAISYYYNNNTKDTDNVSETINEENTEDTQDAQVNEKINEASKETTGVVAGVSTNEKFNLAMENARKAFVANNFDEAIDQYKKALKYKESDTVYAGLYTVYGAQGNWGEAENMLDKAIALKIKNTDYRKWKIGIMDEKTDATFDELKAEYEKALPIVEVETRVNLVTYFAGVAERNGQNSYAISYWQKAIELNPVNKEIYQSEIDRLKAQ